MLLVIEGGIDMKKRLDCRAFGMDCDYFACAQTVEEVLKKAGEHIQAVHKMKGFSKEFYDKALAAIREAGCESGQSQETLSEN